MCCVGVVFMLCLCSVFVRVMCYVHVVCRVRVVCCVCVVCRAKSSYDLHVVPDGNSWHMPAG